MLSVLAWTQGWHGHLDLLYQQLTIFKHGYAEARCHGNASPDPSDWPGALAGMTWCNALVKVKWVAGTSHSV